VRKGDEGNVEREAGEGGWDISSVPARTRGSRLVTAHLTSGPIVVASLRMKLRFLVCVVVLVGTLGLTGCVSTLDGRHQVGWPLSDDTLVSLYERTPKECWTASKDVLTHDGQIVAEDFQRNTIEASRANKSVWVRVEPVDQKVTRVTIQVRSADMELAAQIQTEIAVRLATGNLTPATSPRSTN
jgi:hypothetical protein